MADTNERSSLNMIALKEIVEKISQKNENVDPKPVFDIAYILLREWHNGDEVR